MTQKVKNKIFLFPLALAVIFFSSIIIIFSPVGKKNIIKITPTVTPTVINQSTSLVPSKNTPTPSVITTNQVGYIKKAYVKSNNNYIDIDYIQWIRDNSAPNGSRIINDNPLIRNLEVSKSASISILDLTVHDGTFQKISFSDFVNFNFLQISPFSISLDSSNQVIEIKERYVP